MATPGTGYRASLATLVAASVTFGCGGTVTPAAPDVAPVPAAASGASAGAAVAGNLADDAAGSDSPAPSPATPADAHAAHRRCGWIGADTFAAGKATFLANPDYYDAIHPVWAVLQPDGRIRMLAMADDAEIMAVAAAHHVRVMPLIAFDDPSSFQKATASVTAIQSHAQALTDMVLQHGYDGVELDYEHLWSAGYRAPYQALLTATATLLHAAGKKLTLALPAMDRDYPDTAYDYAFLQATVDVMHLMGYDFHYLGGGHIGPLAPRGWISDVVTRVEALGAPQKYVLGIANYGVGDGWYTSAKDAAARCSGGSHATSTDHMAGCSLGHQDAGVAPHCPTPQGEVWFEDVASMSEKAQLAKAHGLGGIGVYAMGDEPDGFFAAMKIQFGDVQ
ncbi:MAG: hypothetical protein JWN44_1837 [Myxococcales bacterium]|nr:hypothetical protein [Myxococcales bacterium]